MNTDVHHASWKLGVFILLGIGMILILLIALPFFFSNNGKKNVTITQVTPTPFIIQTKTPTNVRVLSKQYTDNGFFRFSYPSTWKRDELGVVGGGINELVRPNNSDSNAIFPRFQIEVERLIASDSAEVRANNLSILNLPKTQIFFHGVSAIKLSGVLPYKGAKVNNPRQLSIIKTYLFMERKGYLYIVSYAFLEDEKRAENEKLINQMSDSFDFL